MGERLGGVVLVALFLVAGCAPTAPQSGGSAGTGPSTPATRASAEATYATVTGLRPFATHLGRTLLLPPGWSPLTGDLGRPVTHDRDAVQLLKGSDVRLLISRLKPPGNSHYESGAAQWLDGDAGSRKAGPTRTTLFGGPAVAITQSNATGGSVHVLSRDWWVMANVGGGPVDRQVVSEIRAILSSADDSGPAIPLVGYVRRAAPSSASAETTPVTSTAVKGRLAYSVSIAPTLALAGQSIVATVTCRNTSRTRAFKAPVNFGDANAFMVRSATGETAYDLAIEGPGTFSRYQYTTALEPLGTMTERITFRLKTTGRYTAASKLEGVGVRTPPIAITVR